MIDFVNKSLIRRQDKIEKRIRPKVHLVTAKSEEEKSRHVLNVPAGLFISPEHEWLSIEVTGVVRIGLDDFAQKMIGSIENIQLPRKGKKVKRGEPLFAVSRESKTLTFPSPVSGEVTSVNSELLSNLSLVNLKPYEVGWICCIEATNLTRELQHLKIGADTLSWYQDEFDRFQGMVKKIDEERKSKTNSNGNGEVGTDQGKENNEHDWEAFSKSFLLAR